MSARVLKLFRDMPGPDELTAKRGIVAEAVVFSDGKAVLHWLTGIDVTETYPSEDDMRLVRERSGRSRFIEAGGSA